MATHGVMSTHRVRDNIRHISPFEAATREALGDGKYVKIARQLGSGDDDVVLVNLAHLCDGLHRPERVVSAVRAGVVPVVASLLANNDARIREKAALALSLIAAVRRGRDELNAHNTLGAAMDLRHDEVDAVYHGILSMLLRYSVTREGAEKLIAEGCMPRLIAHLALAPALRALVLDVLHGVVRWGGIAAALDAGAVSAMVDVLRADDECGLHRRAAGNLALFSLDAACQGAALQCGAVEAIAHTLGAERDVETRQAAAAALMGLSVNEAVKRRAVECGATAVVSALLLDTDEAVLARAIQCATNIAELPSGREALADALPLLRRLPQARGAVVQLGAEPSQRYYM